MKILMVSSESNPLFKCGGLADVVYSLSKKFITYKQRVIILTPFYKKIIRHFDESKKEIFFQTNINFKNKLITVNYIKYIYDDIEFWLVENDEYFNRDNIYGYEDDEERFLFFSLASAALISKKHVSCMMNVKERIKWKRNIFYLIWMGLLLIHILELQDVSSML